MEEGNKVIVGVDPDSVKSGVAVLWPKTRDIGVCKLTFPELMSKLCDWAEVYKDNLLVVVEGGWLNKSNWHSKSCFGNKLATEIGRRTGMNHQTGILIQQMCDAMEIGNKVVKPLRKCWKGEDGKITQEELCAVVGQKLPRMAQDERDAVLLAWVQAGLPIRVVAGVLKMKGMK